MYGLQKLEPSNILLIVQQLKLASKSKHRSTAVDKPQKQQQHHLTLQQETQEQQQQEGKQQNMCQHPTNQVESETISTHQRKGSYASAKRASQ